MLARTHLLTRHLLSSSKLSRLAKMSTFTLPDSDISVKLVDGLTQEQLLEFPAFKNWLTRLQRNLALQKSNPAHEFHSAPYALRSITIQAIDRFGNQRLGFVKLVADVRNAAGESLPGAIFLRGASVGMMVVLQPDDVAAGSEAEKHVLLTVQPRVAAGALQMVELPAGMVDGGTFAGAAAKEIWEELGLEIRREELTDLTSLAIREGEGQEELPRAMFPSPGGCDEYVPLFLCEKRVPRGQLREWTGKLTGLREEGEKITLKLVRLEDLWREGARDAKALGAWSLYEGLKRSGKL